MGGSVNLQGGGQYQTPNVSASPQVGGGYGPRFKNLQDDRAYNPSQYGNYDGGSYGSDYGGYGGYGGGFRGGYGNVSTGGKGFQQQPQYEPAPVMRPYVDQVSTGGKGFQGRPTPSQATAYAPMGIPQMQFARPAFYYPTLANQMAGFGGLGGFGAYQPMISRPAMNTYMPQVQAYNPYPQPRAYQPQPYPTGYEPPQPLRPPPGFQNPTYQPPEPTPQPPVYQPPQPPVGAYPDGGYDRYGPSNPVDQQPLSPDVYASNQPPPAPPIQSYYPQQQQFQAQPQAAQQSSVPYTQSADEQRAKEIMNRSYTNPGAGISSEELKFLEQYDAQKQAASSNYEALAAEQRRLLGLNAPTGLMGAPLAANPQEEREYAPERFGDFQQQLLD